MGHSKMRRKSLKMSLLCKQCSKDTVAEFDSQVSVFCGPLNKKNLRSLGFFLILSLDFAAEKWLMKQNTNFRCNKELGSSISFCYWLHLIWISATWVYDTLACKVVTTYDIPAACISPPDPTLPCSLRAQPATWAYAGVFVAPFHTWRCNRSTQTT